MIQTIQVIILSYINKFKCVNFSEIQKVVNEPETFLAYELFDLVENGYCKKTETGFEITEIGRQFKEISDWSIWIEDSGLDESFDCSFNTNIDRDSQGFPLINSRDQLFSLLGLGCISVDSYHTIYIPKENGVRELSAPSQNLKLRQRWILKNILENYAPEECVHGFTKGKSIVTNAKAHLGKNEIACLDIQNFFPSITRSNIENVFFSFGYSDNISKMLSLICTYKDVLPQGAPTSPMLANIVLAPLDKEICEYASKYNLTYTRYADDITISGEKDLAKRVLKISKLVEKHGFKINNAKTHIMKDNYRKIVTGLVLSENTVKVPKEFKRKLRQEIYYCDKFGIQQHLLNTGRSSAVNFKEYLYGKAYFITMVEPDVGHDFLNQLDNIFSIEI